MSTAAEERRESSFKRPSNVRQSVRRRSSIFNVEYDRRKSRAESLKDSSISFNGRGSISEIGPKKKNYENTYRMTPTTKPKISEMQAVMADVVKGTCEGLGYEDVAPSDLVLTLDKEIYNRLKLYRPPRYRLVIQTIIMQDCEQDLSVCSKWLWDPANDNHFTISLRTKNLLVISIAHFIYLE
jgi:hypothetical protein